jgi:LmbE family N-acetylglucosaminyl deacetylase
MVVRLTEVIVNVMDADDSQLHTPLPAVLFSPHLDDAAFSAALCLMRPGTQVVTVFASPPPDGITLSSYDRLTRATSSSERFHTRLAEDDRAMEILGCKTRRLRELDDQYRRDPLDQQRLTDLLRPFVESNAEIWIPAAIGGHVDHIATRDAVLAAARSCSTVYVYADVPYSLSFGWPSWVTGQADPEHLDVGFWLEQELIRSGLDPALLSARVFRLDQESRTQKERAVLCYETQLPGLRLTPDNPIRWESFLQFEVAWRLEF